MLNTVAVQNYRSLYDLVLPTDQLTVITGANGAGKSNVYGALRLLVAAARGEVVSALAKEGGLANVMWAGPATVSRSMQRGDVPVQGGPRKGPARIRLGFSGAEFGYCIELGLPVPTQSAFNHDPVIKRECIWHGSVCRAAALLVDRKGPLLRRRSQRKWQVVTEQLSMHDSLFDHAGDPANVPEVFRLRETLRNWRFYADFRTDRDAPARRSMPATRTPILHHDGRDLAAALQTIVEVGDRDALIRSIDDAFPGSELHVQGDGNGRLWPMLQQPGLLRPLQVHEWSDGTLRFILLVAALLTPRAPPLIVLNEPETSLHPELIGPLARLISHAAQSSQIWVISHARALVNALEYHDLAVNHELQKSLGRTCVAGLRELDVPAWHWC